MVESHISCQVCRKKFKKITVKHLRQHDMSLTGYKEKYPNASIISELSQKIKSESAVRANKDRIGVKRSEDVKRKISNKTKGRVAHNKGIPMSLEQKEKLSKVHIDAFNSGNRVHWNTGKNISATTKEKISETLLVQELIMSKESIEKRNITIANKKEQGWVSSLKGIKITNVKQLEGGLRGAYKANSNRRANALNHIKGVCSANELTFLKVIDPGYKFLLRCDICDYEFSRTKSCFAESHLSLESYKCPQCFPREVSVSKGEKELSDFIANLIGENKIIRNDRQVLFNKEIDCYIPELKIGFEYTGLYWHAENTGYHAPYHLSDKQQYAYSKSKVNLYTIFEDEWQLKKDIVKSRIRHLLKKTTNNIGARLCEIKAIDNKSKTLFLNENHIQGTDVSKIRYGAYYNNELVAVMTFKKTHYIKGGKSDSYELSRFSVRQNFNIPGISNRLFKRFKIEYSPSIVISYADRRWGMGLVNHHMGFKYVGITKPSYWYMEDYTRRYHRSKFMKHYIVEKMGGDPNLTGVENMVRMGYDRIWDCGTNKWQYEL